jgi:hypothetical protein
MNYKELVVELKEAKSLIDSPEKWTQHKFGRDAWGHGLSTNEWSDTPPACMCSVGAIYEVNRRKDPTVCLYKVSSTRSDNAASFLTRVAGEVITRFNDSHSHAEVMALWDKAIAKAEKLAAEGEEK